MGDTETDSQTETEANRHREIETDRQTDKEKAMVREKYISQPYNDHPGLEDCCPCSSKAEHRKTLEGEGERERRRRRRRRRREREEEEEDRRRKEDKEERMLTRPYSDHPGSETVVVLDSRES